MLSDEWLQRYRLLENFTAKWNGNGNAYDRGDYNSSFALRAVELKTMTRFYVPVLFPNIQITEIGYLDFRDMHQWFRVSRTDVYVNRDDLYGNFAVLVRQVEHTLNIVLNHSISNKICFNISNAPLRMIRIIC